MTIEEFIEKCQKRPIPSNPMAKVRIFAREIAEGAANNLWDMVIEGEKEWLEGTYGFRPTNKFADVNFQKYIIERWQENYPKLKILDTLQYIKWEAFKLHIQSKAFTLVDEAEPATIFISYKRTESSVFALIIEDRLSQAGLFPFLDKQLQAGDDWHTELEEKIKNSDYFIIILGKQTLKSSVTLKEIQWALKYDVAIIPIWHNGFTFKPAKWSQVSLEIAEVINSTHAIRVLEENPLLYDTALREFLNRFGISG